MNTSDGGETWSLQNSGLSLTVGRFMSSFFTDQNKGWATVGTSELSSGLLRTTDGGHNWALDNTISGTRPKSVFFINDQIGWAAGYKIIKTTNGGDSWTEQFASNIYAINFINNEVGWATGRYGIILHTTDGGLNWSSQGGFTDNHLFSVVSKDTNTVWTVGQFNTILTTTNGGVTFMEDEENNYTQPTNFLLSQNHPNPFNPSTIISYQLPIAGNVTLKVYDLLGREVATLVNEEKPAGSYNAQFTINNVPLSSGIYFYKLQAGDFVETKKMSLIK
jgi:photosystem II stability/assembly factor-like uncharacterized protein